MVKSLIENGRIVTTVVKAKEVRRHADRMITLAKQNTLASRRRAIAALQVRFNALTAKETRLAKAGADGLYNRDRKVINRLFDELGPQFAERNGGYTRIVRHAHRVGDNAEQCVLEYIAE